MRRSGLPGNIVCCAIHTHRSHPEPGRRANACRSAATIPRSTPTWAMTLRRMWAGLGAVSPCEHGVRIVNSRSLDTGAATEDHRAVRGAAEASSGGTPAHTKGALDGGQPQPRSRRRHRPALALAPRASRGRGRGAARRWPGGLRQQRLVVVCRQRRRLDAAAGTPKKGGNFRLGVTGGGASDIIDGQSIVTKPDQTRLIGSWETLLTYNEDYVLGTDGLAEEVDSSVPGQVDVRLRSGIEFHNGKTLDRRRRHLLDQAHPEPEGRALRRCRACLHRSEQAQEDGRQHGADRC